MTQQKKIVSIDWCQDTLTERLPWDEEQYVTVRRMTAKERRRSKDLASVFRMGSTSDDNYEIAMRLGEVRNYEWQTCIIDFLFKDADGKVYRYNPHDPDANQRIYDHISDELEEFIDKLIARVNKTPAEVEEVTKNSEDS